MNNEEALALVEQLSSRVESVESKLRGDRDVVRMSILFRLSEIEATFARELGRSSSEFDAIRRFSEAIASAVQKTTTNDEE